MEKWFVEMALKTIIKKQLNIILLIYLKTLKKTITKIIA